ncbi:MAG: amidohydrolase family protein [Bacteroidetes bacterium]|jgi:predicted amidohydrolase YtcJ|nr:amidohydrolase family protein [Bacteroidota bacterium]
MHYELSLIVLALTLLGFAAVPPAAQAQADYVLHNARIYTVNPDQPTAEALAVRGDRLLMVGSDADVLAAYPEADRLDAEGQTVVPGLIDAHAHLMGQGISMLQADLVGTASKAEIIERLEAQAATLPEDAWLLGRGWDQNDWPEQAFPTRHDLDDAFPERPVWLSRIDGHAAWANTAALQTVGLDSLKAMDDPEGGSILRDDVGMPTGVFIDAAEQIVASQVPPPTDAQLEQAMHLAVDIAKRYGLTGVHEAGVDRATIERYQQAIDADAFDLRLYAMVGGLGETFDHICATGPILDYGDKLTVRSVKFYMDGALGSRGAALLDDYADDPGNRGLLMQSPERFDEMVTQAMACGFQVNTHAIGDRANRVVLDAYEHAVDTLGDVIDRHRIEHAQIVAPEDIPRFAELGVIASVQPTHATSDMYWAEDRLGPDRLAGAYAWKAFQDAGVHLTFGSDFPVEQVDPLLGFYAAVTRQDADQWPEGGWTPEQRVDRETALRAFTLDAAYAAYQEDDLGSLEPGKFADFVILSRDIMTIPAPEILETEVVATYLGGEVVYARDTARVDTVPGE